MLLRIWTSHSLMISFIVFLIYVEYQSTFDVSRLQLYSHVYTFCRQIIIEYFTYVKYFVLKHIFFIYEVKVGHCVLEIFKTIINCYKYYHIQSCPDILGPIFHCTLINHIVFGCKKIE